GGGRVRQSHVEAAVVGDDLAAGARRRRSDNAAAVDRHAVAVPPGDGGRVVVGGGAEVGVGEVEHRRVVEGSPLGGGLRRQVGRRRGQGRIGDGGLAGDGHAVAVAVGDRAGYVVRPFLQAHVHVVDGEDAVAEVGHVGEGKIAVAPGHGRRRAVVLRQVGVAVGI